MKLSIKTFTSVFLVAMLVSVKAWGAVCLADQAGSSPQSPYAQSAQLLLMSPGHSSDSQGADHKAGFDCLSACISDAALTLTFDETGRDSHRAQPVAVAAALPIVHTRDFSNRVSHRLRHRNFPRQNFLLRTQRTRC